MPIVPPIFIHADDVHYFPTVGEAVCWLEPADVEPGETGYDAEGRLLHVRVRGKVHRSWIGVLQQNARVEIAPAEEVPTHAETLRKLLGAWLAEMETAPKLMDATLPALLDRARAHWGSKKPRAWTRRETVIGTSIVLVGSVALAVWIGWRLRG